MRTLTALLFTFFLVVAIVYAVSASPDSAPSGDADLSLGLDDGGERDARHFGKDKDSQGYGGGYGGGGYGGYPPYGGGYPPYGGGYPPYGGGYPPYGGGYPSYGGGYPPYGGGYPYYG